MQKLNDHGWSRAEKSKANITEAEVKTLFEMIDKDKSGSLTIRVSRNNIMMQKTLIF